MKCVRSAGLAVTESQSLKDMILSDIEAFGANMQLSDELLLTVGESSGKVSLSYA